MPLTIHNTARLGTLVLMALHLVPAVQAVKPEGPDVRFGTPLFWIYVGVRRHLASSLRSLLPVQVCAVLTIFGGLCSGLSMGLLSQESLHLEVLSKSA